MRWRQLLMLPLLAVDCLGNLVTGGSWNKTISGRAHHARMSHRKYFRWCASCIDTIFFWQTDHCHTHFVRERRHNSVWRAWLITFKGGNPDEDPQSGFAVNSKTERSRS